MITVPLATVVLWELFCRSGSSDDLKSVRAADAGDCGLASEARPSSNMLSALPRMTAHRTNLSSSVRAMRFGSQVSAKPEVSAWAHEKHDAPLHAS